MIKVTNIQATRIIGVLLILLSGDAFAVTYATQPALNTEITNRKAADTAETTRATKAEGALKAADTAEVKNRNKAINTAVTAAKIRGNHVSDMQYWDGNRWVMIPAPVFTSTAHGPPAMVTLNFCSNSISPTWKAACEQTSPILHPPNPNGPYKIGGVGPAGGIVFYITNKGYNGLEAAPVDQSAAITWGCDWTDIPSAYGLDVGTGVTNTAAIVNACSESNIAAKVAYDYSYNGYTDWFLPSGWELDFLKQHMDVVGLWGNYWSSSVVSAGYAYSLVFSAGFGLHSTPKGITHQVLIVP